MAHFSERYNKPSCSYQLGNKSFTQTPFLLIWFGTGEEKNFDKPHSYALYFDRLSFASLKTDTDVIYTETRPGYYRLESGSGTSEYLILTESYYPTWVLNTDQDTVSSTKMFQSINGWETSDVRDATLVALEFTVGWQRAAGRTCSLLALLAMMALPAILAIRRRRHKLRRQSHPRTERPSESRDLPPCPPPASG